MLVEIEHDDRERFREVYLHKVRPYLDGPGNTDAELADPLAFRRNVRSFAPVARRRPYTACWTIWKTSAKKSNN